MEQWLEQTLLLGDSELREVGNLICEKRKARGWSQNDLAGYLGSDYRVVSRHENGHGMNLESLVRYSQVFSCPITALLPAKFRQNISPQLLDVLAAVAVLPEEKQNTIAAMCILSIGNPQKGVRTFSWTIYQSMSTTDQAAMSPRLLRY